jgi:hypothetical protein
MNGVVDLAASKLSDAAAIQTQNERVTYITDPDRPDRYRPQISSRGAPREFEARDMDRVLDFENVTVPAPADGQLMMGESDPQGAIDFPVYHFCLRGGFMFYFDPDDVDDESGPYAAYVNPPKGVIPLENIIIEFPPGGRRVFREHATTNARNGYELVIAHLPEEEEPVQPPQEPDDLPSDNQMRGSVRARPPFFLVAESLGQRDKWATAMKARVDSAKPTKLRTGYSMTQQQRAPDGTPLLTGEKAGLFVKAAKSILLNEKALSTIKGSESEGEKRVSIVDQNDSAAARDVGAATSAPGLVAAVKKLKNRRGSMLGTKTSVLEQQVMAASDDAELTAAVVEFGQPDFSEKEWIDKYFQIHNDYGAINKIHQMETWQSDMKKSLKGAVLEQYEYFVQASGEMTTMGHEVTSLRTLISLQVDLIKELRNIDYTGDLGKTLRHQYYKSSAGSSGMGGTGGDDEGNLNQARDLKSDLYDLSRIGQNRNKGNSMSDDRSIFSEYSSVDGRLSAGRDDRLMNDDRAGEDGGLDEIDDPNAPPIEVPKWLDEVTDDIAAFIRECRYQDATDLWSKARSEIADLWDKHERPTAYRLKWKQIDALEALRKKLDRLSKRMGIRMEETLRRKNEALKQASKRERSDPAGIMTPTVSPCSVNDDSLYLQLLVRLGRTHNAAEAYSMRRSLLLLEALHENPISGSGTVDLVIYAAQLSQSFFSCLATSVEGFLDLFLMSQSMSQRAADDSGAAAGGLSGSSNHQSDNMSLDESSLHSQTSSKAVPSGAMASVVLWCDSELSKFALAFGGTRILANLALCPPPRDSSTKGPRILNAYSAEDGTGVGKERRHAVEIAAQCLDQAFMYASQNLDAVGLPLAPRLAECLRPRLKGCEAEISQLLDPRWQHLVVDWQLSDQFGDYDDGIVYNGQMNGNGTSGDECQR